MADEFQKSAENSTNNQQVQPQAQVQGQQEQGQQAAQPSAPLRQPNAPIIGRGGDPLFRRINATKEQLTELLDETSIVQDWVQRETSNNVALACLNNENLKEIYFAIKDGFGEYGPITLMGFKTPQGIEIPRLKIYDSDGNVLNVLTGPMAIDELNKRALAYKESENGYEQIQEIVQEEDAIISSAIEEYSGNS